MWTSIFGMSYGLMTDWGLWFIADGRLYICSVLGILPSIIPAFTLYTLHLTLYTLHHTLYTLIFS